jgi:FAD/FMN-containing dehydrogenase
MLAEWRGGAELAAMRAVKAALDPRAVMNPGKLLP